jgi:phospholipid/cholesterol/gamma-HCH transport system substrate-binding protein
MPRKNRLLASVTIVVTLTASGCSYETLGSPKGKLTLTADFTDVQNLVVGHGVQIANVRVGTVTGVKLVGKGSSYRVQVTMSIKNGVKVPQGTAAQLSITSLLGENYVALQPPSTGLDTGPYLPDHGKITVTSVVPAFEQVVGKAGPLLEAISGNDLGAIVTAGSAAFDGRGPELQKMIGQANALLALFASQRSNLDAAVTNLARLGHDLAKGQDQLGKLPGSLAKATKVLSDNRYQLLDTVKKLTDLARTTDNEVLLGRTRQLQQLLDELGPVIATLASDKTNLSNLIRTAQLFVERVPQGVYNGQLLLYPILSFNVYPSSGSSTSQATAVMNALNSMLGRAK